MKATVRSAYGKSPSHYEEFFECEMNLVFLPAKGDTLMLGDQDVTVDERVIWPDGRVELWIGPFPGWERDSVAALFAPVG